jgi:mannose-6-phosphate isomerase-like protein (cupin superfamily)
MLTVLTAKELLLPAPSRTMQFEGESLDAAISFLVVDLAPGEGPAQHVHPYAEVFIPLEGRALFMSVDLRRESGPEEVVVVGPHTAHGFQNSGTERLRMVCMHANGQMITEWLESQSD